MTETEALEDAKEVVVLEEEECAEKMVYMWGYLPGASPEKSPILSPAGESLRSFTRRRFVEGRVRRWLRIRHGHLSRFVICDVAEKGKLITWGSADDEGQSYLISGKHGEIPGLYQLPTEASVVKAAAGWAHCASVNEQLESPHRLPVKQRPIYNTSALLRNIPCLVQKKVRYMPGAGKNVCLLGKLLLISSLWEVSKRMLPGNKDSDSQASGDEFFTVSPSLVTLASGVKITSVAVGGRHTLALSGSLCDKSSAFHQGSGAGAQGSNVTGSYVMDIACGGRHSVVITDAGALLTFGWGLYGQCGQGNNADQLRPTLVPSLLGTRVEKIAAGLWHTLCVSVNGQIYAFGGNQFGQLGTGSDQPESNSDDDLPGQLGLGDSVDRNIPGQVSIAGCRPRNVACGWWHTLLMGDKTSFRNRLHLSHLDASIRWGCSQVPLPLTVPVSSPRWRDLYCLVENIFGDLKDVKDVVKLSTKVFVTGHYNDQ
ncbi:hypothetical protein JHK82_043452 [Glycine max]|nr:hypothetical protein JHK82_043452 [Glycine max]